MKITGRSLLLGVPVAALAVPGLAAAQEVHAQRVKVEVLPPKTPETQEAYELLKRSRWMEEAQEFFGIFKLPQDITIFVRSCGMSNAWYVHGTVTVCYEYLDDIIKSIPPGDTPEGITPRDAARGQFVYTLTHEMGHALFDVLEIPILGAPEDAADDFAAYMMLQLGKERARQLMLGAAYSYANYIKNPRVTVTVGRLPIRTARRCNATTTCCARLTGQIARRSRTWWTKAISLRPEPRLARRNMAR
jgi:hypothetical protein